MPWVYLLLYLGSALSVLSPLHWPILDLLISPELRISSELRVRLNSHRKTHPALPSAVRRVLVVRLRLLCAQGCQGHTAGNNNTYPQ